MFIDRKFRLARIWSNNELKKVAHIFAGKIINVSAWDDRDKQGDYYCNYFTNATDFYYSNYYGDRGIQNKENEIFIDLTKELPVKLQSKFDVVFNHTTLEHIFDVRMAFKNLCDMTKDVVIIIVPFAQVQHECESYKDYWRFTPSCLREMFKKNGLMVIYEKESNPRNASIYLFFIASRFPKRWQKLIPKYEHIKEAGSWLGEKNILLRNNILDIFKFKKINK